jgi:hypothetical protein
MTEQPSSAAESAPSAAPPDAALRSWQSVLAAVEADLQRTQTLLASARPNVAIGAPAETMLPSPHPTGEAHWAELPAFEDMPPVPPELAERIRTLRVSIVALQAEIAAEMAAWRASYAARPREQAGPNAAARPALFVDRRL